MRKRRIPPMLTDIVQAALASYDNVLFDSCDTCPSCGGDLSGYDIKKRQFAVVMDGEQKKVIPVRVKRFRCRSCRQIHPADQPFYPDTRIGSLAVDLCVTLGGSMPFSRVSSCLYEMGVVVDRWSVRNYIRNNRRTVPGVDMFGFTIPLSIVSHSALAMGIPAGGSVSASDLLAACGYPSGKNTGSPPQEAMTGSREG
ncbi:DUF6431 domain-containing protein [Methanoregula formicica]|uniref:DUF6431 domain-containing protein n=1 Tax=Methanoregula formicica (strain DSM 22288 / NBRC 105244 / SMSP) TaxID=593750 RepID=L0HF63_METFS|nr:DUF6431 domain-containing protein [Methanoregula formicica]AGB01709.1 hypothetical protein Metfor_0649 [Methanoregula formicica SMSP]